MNHSSDFSQGLLHAGVGKAEITIAEKAVAVHDPLYVKALVLDDGECRGAIITLDAVAIGGIADVADDFLPRLRKRLESELGIPAPHVMVTASHTHPSNRLLCGEEEQIQRTFDAVKRASDSLAPVLVGSGKSFENRIAINRVLRLKNGKEWTIRQSTPCPPDEEVSGLGPFDPEIGLLRLDRLEGDTLAVVYNYACHTLIGVPSGAITANFPGFASKVIEDNLPGAMAFFIQGAAGDVTELLYKDVNRPRDARPLGMMLGLSVLQGLKDIATGPGILGIVNESLSLPRRTDGAERIRELEEEQKQLLASLRFSSLNLKSFLPLYLKHLQDPEHPGDYSYRYLQEESIGISDLVDADSENRRHLERYIHNIHRMEKLVQIVDSIETLKKHQEEIRRAKGRFIATETMGFRIGNFVLITSAAELCTEIGLKIKRSSPFEHTFLASFTNGYIHYGASAEAYHKGSYEVTECLLAPEWQQIFEDKAGQILQNLRTPPLSKGDAGNCHPLHLESTREERVAV